MCETRQTPKVISRAWWYI